MSSLSNNKTNLQISLLQVKYRLDVWNIISLQPLLSVIAVFPINHGIGTGWKQNDVPCREETGAQFKQCIERNSYSVREILADTSSKMVESREDFAGNIQAMAQILRIGSGAITSSLNSSIDVEFNNTLSYYIFFLDPLAEFFSMSPIIIPSTMISLVKNHLLVYIKV